MRLYLIRHPRPVVESGVCYGSTDLPVAVTEVEDALSALPVLPAALSLYSSPLRRCHAFARRLAAARNLPAPVLDLRLQEMHFGQWEMQAWSKIPRDEVDTWAADVVSYQPGGGESVLQVAQRVQSFLQALRAKQADAIIVCHAGTIRLLQALRDHTELTAAALHAARQPHALAYGGMCMLDMPD